MNRRRNLLLGLVSGALAGLLVYGIYLLQLRQVRWTETVMVVVPNDFVDAGVRLEPDMLRLRPMLRGELQPDMATSIGQVAGQETVVPLGQGEAVRLWKVDRFGLLPREGELTFQLPKEYVLSISNGIRAGDRVRLYASGANAPDGPVLSRDVVVASVKSAGNVEVDNPKQPSLYSRLQDDREKLYASRREANGPIQEINLNLTPEEWLEIDRICGGSKTKLVVAYAGLPEIQEEGMKR
ncbi:flagellar biosynthesis protein FlgA [Paenibacillus thermoaerophilus]|jgi:hypothetical protein|uniref:Flagellar biosynthesis protein FlgA n=1 Tax=Paenibacillus thermoaerophilus TaxID=1215385 RepID=A0ABW2V7Y4_9BACL|nr:SAF domain-containing protein [Paenibacillus thermoaerophilus]TMV16117.1 flagellar biosynthesis protein FlgA [Paenibacillus thermoaerophilus]